MNQVACFKLYTYYPKLKKPFLTCLLSQAIDVWMGLCTAFVFSALVEFTVVNFWYRKQRFPVQDLVSPSQPPEDEVTYSKFINFNTKGFSLIEKKSLLQFFQRKITFSRNFETIFWVVQSPNPCALFFFSSKWRKNTYFPSFLLFLQRDIFNRL